jgi:Cd2+/Zn2+-exporting ATPase
MVWRRYKRRATSNEYGGVQKPQEAIRLEVADIALMNDKLSLMPFLIRLSKKTLLRIKTNRIFIGEGSFIVLAVLGYGNLVWLAADVGVTLVVILLSLNLMRFEAK